MGLCTPPVGRGWQPCDRPAHCQTSGASVGWAAGDIGSAGGDTVGHTVVGLGGLHRQEVLSQGRAWIPKASLGLFRWQPSCKDHDLHWAIINLPAV